MLDGSGLDDPIVSSYAPPPEINPLPIPPGGDSDATGPSQGDPTSWDPSLTPGYQGPGGVVSPPPEGDPSLESYGTGPIVVKPAGAFD
jgi:hypothetical protein